MFTDISEEKKQQQRLEFLAHCDPLTGLANRRSFGEQLALAVREAAAHGEVMAVLLLNLDRFKDVNDSYGHAVGDEVLKHITRQVRAALRPGDLVGRWPVMSLRCWRATCAMPMVPPAWHAA